MVIEYSEKDIISFVTEYGDFKYYYDSEPSCFRQLFYSPRLYNHNQPPWHLNSIALVSVSSKISPQNYGEGDSFTTFNRSAIHLCGGPDKLSDPDKRP